MSGLYIVTCWYVKFFRKSMKSKECDISHWMKSKNVIRYCEEYYIERRYG